MNKDNAKDYLHLVQALSEGKGVELLCANGKWETIPDPSFDLEATNYRIKPEAREIWINEYPNGDQLIHETAVNAANARRDDGITIHYREVIE